jgi:hypothetical protein
MIGDGTGKTRFLPALKGQNMIAQGKAKRRPGLNVKNTFQALKAAAQ